MGRKAKLIEYESLEYINNDEIFFHFIVKEIWMKKYFKEKIKGTKTNGFIEKEKYVTLFDFNNDYTWDDAFDVYLAAKNENQIIERIDNM